MTDRAPLWTLVGIFVVFKLATTAMIIAADSDGIGTTLGIFVVFHWPMLLAGLGFGVTAVVFRVLWRVRLVRARARRSEFEAAEWRVD